MLTPYEHQKRAISQAIDNLQRHGFHALFMEMGTGKTKTTIDTFLSIPTFYNSLLIIAPKAICSVWIDDELPKHMNVPYAIATWDGRTTKKSEEEFGRIIESEEKSIYVVNVEAFQSLPEAMRNRVRTFLQKRLVLMVIDESSYIKTYNAKRSKNILLAGKLAKGRMILSGTEITNTPLDLYMQFEFLHPGFWNVKSYFLFRARYALLEDAYGPGGRTFKKVVGFQRMQELMDRISPYCSRALKKDCLDLPEKIHVKIHVELSDSQRRIYKELKEQLMALIEESVLTVPNKVALFTKFRQITGGAINVKGESKIIDDSPPKLQMLLAELQDTDEQAIITAAFTHEIKMLVRELSKLAPTVAFFGDNVVERDIGKRLFMEGKVRFMVLNPQAGAFGLNLQDHCHLQYSYSRVLSPSQNWQMEDRIHRPGQKEVCVYKTLITKGTVDERIEELLAAKTDIRAKFQDMTIEDIFNLV